MWAFRSSPSMIMTQYLRRGRGSREPSRKAPQSRSARAGRRPRPPEALGPVGRRRRARPNRRTRSRGPRPERSPCTNPSAVRSFPNRICLSNPRPRPCQRGPPGWSRSMPASSSTTMDTRDGAQTGARRVFRRHFTGATQRIIRACGGFAPCRRPGWGGYLKSWVRKKRGSLELARRGGGKNAKTGGGGACGFSGGPGRARRRSRRCCPAGGRSRRRRARCR